MAKDYDYSSKYTEIDSNIKYRRCGNCKNMISIDDLETKKCCKICYTIINSKKRCSRCQLRKSTNCFGKDMSYTDGYKALCKICNPKKYNPKKQKEANKRYRDKKKNINNNL